MNSRRSSFVMVAALMLAAFSARAELPKPVPAGATRVPVEFTGGYETDPRDGGGGRPVVLIAAALGVSSDVFREAFSHVHPAHRDGGPTGDEARANKAALMNALGKYGITNDRLDEVSNYYRYMRSKGQMWKTKPASANALVKNGAVIGFEIVDAGAGYSSAPTVSVPGVNNVNARVDVSYGKNLATNGAISAITVTADKAK